MVTVSGDGGFLMHCQELETAVRLGTAVVNIVWENHEFGSIAWKQVGQLNLPFRRRLRQPRLCQVGGGLRDAGLAMRERGGVRAPVHQAGRELDVPSLIVVPIDYSIPVALSGALGTETVAT